jgi:Domain of unknown function (DUF4337)
MNDLADFVGDELADRDPNLSTLVAMLVALAATFLALCNVKDGNIVQGMAQAQANSVDAWSYYQAKSTKQHMAEALVDQLTVQRELGGATLSAEAKSLLDRKIIDYSTRAKQYETEKAEIKKTAEEYQKSYDRLNLHDDQFDMAEACLSLSIALFGITALTRKRWLFAFGFVLAAFGVALGLAGFLGWSLHPNFLAKILG